MENIKISLQYPVKLPDGMLTTVTVSRPTVGDMIDFPVKIDSSMSEISAYVSHLCGLNIEDFRKIDVSDFVKIQESVSRFQERNQSRIDGERAAAL